MEAFFNHSFYFISYVFQDFLSVAHYDHISLLLSRMLYSLENQSGSEWRRLTSSRQMKTFLFLQNTVAKIIKFCPNIMRHFCLLNNQNTEGEHKSFTKMYFICKFNHILLITNRIWERYRISPYSVHPWTVSSLE